MVVFVNDCDVEMAVTIDAAHDAQIPIGAGDAHFVTFERRPEKLSVEVGQEPGRSQVGVDMSSWQGQLPSDSHGAVVLGGEVCEFGGVVSLGVISAEDSHSQYRHRDPRFD